MAGRRGVHGDFAHAARSPCRESRGSQELREPDRSAPGPLSPLAGPDVRSDRRPGGRGRDAAGTPFERVAWRTPSCSSVLAEPARPHSRGSSRRRSTARTSATATRATPARRASPSARAGRSTSSRSTRRRIAASTRSASFASGSTTPRQTCAARSTSSTRRTRSPRTPGTRSSSRSRSRPSSSCSCSPRPTREDFPPAVLSRLQRFDVRRLTTRRDRGQAAAHPRGRRARGRASGDRSSSRASPPAACATPSRCSTSSSRRRRDRLDEDRVRDLLGLADAEHGRGVRRGARDGRRRRRDPDPRRTRGSRSRPPGVPRPGRRGRFAGAIVAAASTAGRGACRRGVAELVPAARRLAAIDPSRAGIGGLRLQLELALFPRRRRRRSRRSRPRPPRPSTSAATTAAEPGPPRTRGLASEVAETPLPDARVAGRSRTRARAGSRRSPRAPDLRRQRTRPPQPDRLPGDPGPVADRALPVGRPISRCCASRWPEIVARISSPPADEAAHRGLPADRRRGRHRDPRLSRRTRRSCATSPTAAGRSSRRGSARSSAGPSPCAASRPTWISVPAAPGRCRRGVRAGRGAAHLRRRRRRGGPGRLTAANSPARVDRPAACTRRRGRPPDWTQIHDERERSVTDGHGEPAARWRSRCSRRWRASRTSWPATEVEGSAGGGVVRAIVTGKQELVAVDDRPRPRSIRPTSRCSRTSSSPPSTTPSPPRAPGRGEDGGRDRRAAPARGTLAHVASPLIEPVARLIEAFTRLPGIGPKTAQRLTYHLLRAPDAEARALAAALVAVREQVVFCELLLQHQRRAALPDLPRRRARRAPPVRRRGAARRARHSSGRASSAAATTSSTGRSRRSTGSGRTGSGSASCLQRADERRGRRASRSRRSSSRRTRRSRARRRRCTSPSGSTGRSARHPDRPRPAGRRRPRVRRRGHPDPGPPGPAARSRTDAGEQPRRRDPAPPRQGRSPRRSSASLVYVVLVGPLGATRGRAGAAVLAVRGRVHPARRVEPDLTLRPLRRTGPSVV